MVALMEFIECARKCAKTASMLAEGEMDWDEIESIGEAEQGAQLLTNGNDKLLKNETFMETEAILLDETAATMGLRPPESNPISTAAAKREIDESSVSCPLNTCSSKPKNHVSSSLEKELDAQLMPRESKRKVKHAKEECIMSSLKSIRSAELENAVEHNSASNFLPQDELDAKAMRQKSKRERTSEQINAAGKRQRMPRGVKQATTTKKRQFRCAECAKTFGLKISFDAHVRRVHKGIEKPFRCEHCDKAYACSSGLTEHIKITHQPEAAPIVCSYPGCEKVYTSFSGYHKHKKLKHLGKGLDKKHVCEHCGLGFSQSGNLNSHRRNRHPTDAELAMPKQPKDKFECHICQKVVHKRYALDCHILQHHSKDLKYECEQCGKKMAKRFMLVQHMLVHTPPAMPCEHCGKQFKRKFDLELHIRSVHTKEKSFKCDICGKTFALKNWLLAHKHVHDSEEQKIPCQECDKLFRFKYDLKKHVRLVHLRMKPHVCSYCGQAFGSGGSLRHHVYIHTGEKPYECDICGKCFRQPTALKTHRNIHLKQPNAEV